jgi:phosphoribosylanthranilate isomerase
MALAAGADALGLVSAMPSGPGVIDEARIVEIVRFIDGRAETFLLTSLTEADAIVTQHERCGTSAIQLVDALPPSQSRRLRAALPRVRLVRVLHVTGAGVVADARAASEWADVLLLDSGNPSLAMKELGGTGRVHDWTLSRRVRDEVSIPVFLAGGLNHGNVASAIRAVSPFGVDVCSGVRRDGVLDTELLSRFMDAARRQGRDER